MRLKISDLMDAVYDDSFDMEPKESVSAASAERIREAAMKKIHTEQKTQKKRRVHTRMIAVAAAVILLAAAATAAILSNLNVREVAADEKLTYETEHNGLVNYDSASAVLTVPVQGESFHDVVFQTAYLPVGQDDPALGGTDYATDLQALAEESGKSYEDVLAEAGLTAEEAEASYLTLWYTAGSDFFRIDCYNGAQLSGTEFILDGEMASEREAELCGHEALYLTLDMTSSSGGGLNTRNHIFLYDSTRCCLIDVSGTCSFEELEKIAEGLTLTETALEAENTLSDGFSYIGSGVG